jgi:hypothetical protein
MAVPAKGLLAENMFTGPGESDRRVHMDVVRAGIDKKIAIRCGKSLSPVLKTHLLEPGRSLNEATEARVHFANTQRELGEAQRERVHLANEARTQHDDRSLFAFHNVPGKMLQQRSQASTAVRGN